MINDKSEKLKLLAGKASLDSVWQFCRAIHCYFAFIIPLSEVWDLTHSNERRWNVDQKCGELNSALRLQPSALRSDDVPNWIRSALITLPSPLTLDRDYTEAITTFHRLRDQPPPSRLTQLLWSLAAIVLVICVAIALLASAGILK